MRIVSCLVFLSACCRTSECLLERYGIGGGQDVVSANLPFDSSFTTTCMQGVGGDYSHHFDSTYYDVDFDTPNDEDVIVYAPIGGIAYVHDTDRNTNFGVHVNIDLGDGTYIVLAHLEDVFVGNGSEVTAGQMIGFEGTTGASTGDHVHIGRHDGDPSADAIYGDSIEGLSFMADEGSYLTSEMDCSLSGGGRYGSLLATPRWRPSGSLVMTPYASTVYSLDGFALRPFSTQSSFISRNFEFTDVALVSEEEVACYSLGEEIDGDSQLKAVYADDDVWLLVGAQSDADRYRIKVASQGWQGVLKTWGIIASTYDDLEDDDDLVSSYPSLSGPANYRDGSLVSPIEDSAVYVMADGAALPIDRYETLLLLGWEERDVIEVGEAEFQSVATVRGNCSTGSYCLDSLDVITCGGLHESGEGTYPAEGTLDTGDAPEEEADETTSSDDTTDQSVSSNELQLTWQMPASARADRISLSGEFTDSDGYSYGWGSNIATSSNSDIVTLVLFARPGDSFRFSIEYVLNGMTSWSCLAPYPPGTTMGTAVATYDGVSLSVVTADDPASDGCGLAVTIPN